MKIGIGALATSKNAGVRQSGIHRYAIQLIEHLADALGDDQAVVYAGNTSIETKNSSISVRKTPVPVEHPAVRVAWENLVLPLKARQDKIDLYHGLAFTVPEAVRIPSVVTIHDLAFLRWPEQVPDQRSRYLSRAVRAAVTRATRVIAVSEHTKHDVMDLLGVPEDRIDVTPLGVDPSMRPAGAAAIETFRERQGLANPYILAVGNLEPRKNLAALVRAFALVADCVPHYLVLVGAEGWRTEELHLSLDNPEIRNRVRLQGFVAPAELPLWYSSCEFFVIPSHYEGFGLSLLEALACGAPAISSNRASLPEVGGDAALLVDPEIEPLAAALKIMAENQDFRSLLSSKGPVQAANFTWQRTAELTVESYRKAVS